MVTRSLLFTFILSLFSIAAFSKDKTKFGKTTMEQLKMTTYEADTSAVAVILFDEGYSTMRYVDGKGWFIDFQRNVRIKILKKSGYNWADFSIGMHNSTKSSHEEGIGSIKGITYNLENGKMVKTKMERNSVFTERVNKNYSRCKFALPKVKVGSVIEVKYTIASDYIFYYPDWQFQYSIPVVYSKYVTRIPEYFIYQPISYGYENIYKSTENESGQLTSTYYTDDANSTVGNGKTKHTVSKEFTVNVSTYIGTNLTAFKDEPYTTCAWNYLSRIDFDLSSYDVPWDLRQDFSRTWQSINKELMENQYFGLQFNRLHFAKNDIEALGLNGKKPLEQMLIAHNFLVNKMAKNRKNTIYVNESLRKAYNEGVGNSADINLIYMNILRNLGIKAHPVVLSTRANGILHPIYPSLTQFNYVIVLAEIDNKGYLLDATNKNSPYYLIPKKCLNNMGRLISKDFTKWVDLNINQNYKLFSQSLLTLNEDGTFKGKIDIIKENYAALDFRNNLKKKDSKEDYIKSKETDIQGLNIVNYTFKNVDSCYAPVKEKYEVEIENFADVLGDNIYFNPLLFDALKKNNFKLEQRKYPVDFAYPYTKVYIKKINFPENYEIEEMPESGAFALPNNAGRFIYNFMVNGNQITVNATTIISKSVFLTEEYPYLKQFYDEMVKKQSAQVVLKKKG